MAKDKLSSESPPHFPSLGHTVRQDIQKRAAKSSEIINFWIQSYVLDFHDDRNDFAKATYSTTGGTMPCRAGTGLDVSSAAFFIHVVNSTVFVVITKSKVVMVKEMVGRKVQLRDAMNVFLLF